MSHLPSIEAEITFLKPEDGGRRQLPQEWGSYLPHLVVGDGEYLGVRFVSGQAPSPGIPARITLELSYHARVNYAALQQGVAFEVREGGRVVGVGKVLSSTADAP